MSARASEHYDQGNLKSSFILDYGNSAVQFVVTRLNNEYPAWIDFLRASYGYIKGNVHPAFSLDPFVSASTILENKKGASNQRLALLEAMARSKGIPTRSRGVVLKKALWEKQLGMAKGMMPETLVVGWPQFWIDDRWMGVEELFGPMAEWVQKNPPPFNAERQTLFDALDNTLVDLTGQSGEARYGLKGFIVPGGGVYDTRDELFAKLCPPAGNRFSAPLADMLLAKKLSL